MDLFDVAYESGLAVSGGVDSMALAWLCASQSRDHQPPTDLPVLDFKAYIVDHKARDGSTQEAIKTQERLLQMGELSQRCSWGSL